ncbi:MAG TPA: ABC transporter ATP-binding protein [Pseudonocardiaceae bacterium]|jgi:ABC-2 type transport system ATP-binding protein|nr:ABC transporter ATP-binding protein [Pseudonocardiaceae bacterium]
MNAIEVTGLAKSYDGEPAVVDVGFTVAEGEVVAILGPNGAGKTTTVEILEGFRTRDAGTVRVLGVDPARGGRRWRTGIGIVMQSTSLDAELTVGELLSLYAGLYPRPRPIDEVLEMVGLADDVDTRAGTLSGGQQRRVDLALGVVGNPRVLFLDEPTTGFDPAARRQTWRTVRDLSAAGMTVLLTTHYLDEAAALADRVLVFTRGRVVADEPPDQLTGGLDATRIRFPLPAGHSVPVRGVVTDGWCTVTTQDVTATVGALVDWARAEDVRLDGMTVAPPSLEDAYLALTMAADHV